MDEKDKGRKLSGVFHMNPAESKVKLEDEEFDAALVIGCKLAGDKSSHKGAELIIQMAGEDEGLVIKALVALLEDGNYLFETAFRTVVARRASEVLDMDGIGELLSQALSGETTSEGFEDDTDDDDDKGYLH